jgi:hypothetical protein
MTNQQHPITPPPELVEQWRNLPEYTDGKQKLIMVTLSTGKLQHIATQAAQWGADQELEACCEYLARCAAWAAWELEDVQEMLDFRRPKPPSLKERALKILEEEPEADDMKELIVFDTDQVNIIRRALESLPD